MGSHHHHHHHDSGKNLKIAFFLNLAFTVFEIIGGIFTNSIAIISDAIHDLGDSLSLGTAWYLDHKSKQGKNHKYSFGYARFSLLGALINSLVLIAGSVYVINEAIKRISHPEVSDAKGMLIFALFGIAVNGFAAWKMSHGKSLNEKVVSWHLIEDVLGWVAILIGAVILNFKEVPYLDPAMSLLITAYILWGVIGRLKETLFVFLQGVPKEIDLLQIEKELLGINGVNSLHHTHIWSLEGEHHVFSTHLKLEKVASFDEIKSIKQSSKIVLEPYAFKHVTIETELEDEECMLSNEDNC